MYASPTRFRQDELDEEEEIDPKAHYACIDQVWLVLFFPEWS